ncbi:biotin transport system substrate-specific component [Bradyrhizobium sp. LM6.10]
MSDRSVPSTATSHSSLAALMWPTRPGEAVGALRALVLIALGTGLMALSAKVNLPLPYVPMTLQTLVVLMIGAAYGWRLGSATMVAYLAEGAMGLPVFAGPVGGIAPLVGPTAGYLFGFIGAAFVTGWLAERGWDRSVVLLFAAMAVGHILILAAGFGWLAFRPRPGRREGVAGRPAAVRCGLAGQERAWRDVDAGDTPGRRSPVIRAIASSSN